jgi:hypothetical protein
MNNRHRALQHREPQDRRWTGRRCRRTIPASRKLGPPPLPGELGRPILRRSGRPIRRRARSDAGLDPGEQRRLQENRSRARQPRLRRPPRVQTAQQRPRLPQRSGHCDTLPTESRRSIRARCRTCRIASSPSSTLPSIKRTVSPIGREGVALCRASRHCDSGGADHRHPFRPARNDHRAGDGACLRQPDRQIPASRRARA